MKAFLDLDGPPPRQDLAMLALPREERLEIELKGLFSALSSAPIPDRLLRLADALEEAYRRGELHKGAREDVAS